MRLWHYELIPILPRAQLLGQHRECCALRGLGWGRKHATVDYVFTYPPDLLWKYNVKVMTEMRRRGYKVNLVWTDPYYRGKRCQPWAMTSLGWYPAGNYPEHDNTYMEDCLDNLRRKGIDLS